MPYRVKKIFLNILRSIIGDWYYFLYDERKHENSLIHNYYNKSDECHIGHTQVVYIANGFCNHAGLADRLKGMIAVYDWCKKNKIDFRIYHRYPFALEDYIIPNLYDWRITDEEICYNKKFVSVNHFMMNHLTADMVKSGDIICKEKEWLRKRISSTKIQHHMYTNMAPENEKVFQNCFKDLFKPAPKIKTEISQHLANIGNKYIAISFRFMQLLGDFIDCDGEILPPKKQQELIARSLNVIKTIKQEHSYSHKILVTSDSLAFLESAKRLPFVYVIDGKIGHISYEKSDEVNKKTFVDFFMIAHASKVFLAKTDKMYNSDFARRASMIYNRDFEIFRY